MNINGAPLSRVENTKFLGVIIHQNLSWKPHISAVKEKTSKVIVVMCKSRQYLPPNTLKTLYNSLFLTKLVPWACYSAAVSWLAFMYHSQQSRMKACTGGQFATEFWSIPPSFCRETGV